MKVLLGLIQPAFEWTWKNSLQVALLVGLVLLVQTVLARWLTPRLRYALSLLILLRLLLPAVPSSPLSLENLFRPAARLEAHSLAPERGRLGEASLPEASLPDGPISSMVAEPAPVAPTTPPPVVTPFVAAPVSRWPALSVAEGLGLAWACGLLALVSLAGWRYTQWCRLIRQGRRLSDPRLLALLDGARQAMGVRRPVTLVAMARLGSPAVFGFRRVRLLLPETMLDQLTDQDLRLLFLHEMAHVRRHDMLLNLVLMAVQFIHWFNPLVWLGLHRLHADREPVCDAMVLQRTSPEERLSYGSLLLKLLTDFPTDQAIIPTAVPVVSSQRELKRRIISIKHHRRSSLAASLTTGLTAVALAFATFTGASQQPSIASEPGKSDVAASSLATNAPTIVGSPITNQQLWMCVFLLDTNKVIKEMQAALGPNAANTIPSDQTLLDYLARSGANTNGVAHSFYYDSRGYLILLCTPEAIDGLRLTLVSRTLLNDQLRQMLFPDGSGAPTNSSPTNGLPVEIRFMPGSASSRMLKILEQDVTVHLENVPLESLLANLSSNWGVAIVADKSLPAITNKLSVIMDKVRLDDLFRYLARNYSLQFQVRDEVVRVVDAKEEKKKLPPGAQDPKKPKEESRFYRLRSSSQVGPTQPEGTNNAITRCADLDRAITNQFKGSRYLIDYEHNLVVACGTREQLDVMENIIRDSGFAAALTPQESAEISATRPLPAPAASDAGARPPTNLVVRIDAHGQLFLGNKSVTIGELRTNLMRELAKHPAPHIFIVAEKSAPMETLIMVMDADKKARLATSATPDTDSPRLSIIQVEPTPPNGADDRPRSLNDGKPAPGNWFRTLEDARQAHSEKVLTEQLNGQTGVRVIPSETNGLFSLYDRVLGLVVQSRWHELLAERSDPPPPVSVTLEFHLHSDGRVTDLRALQNTGNGVFMLIAQKAVLDPAPYATWPSDLRREYTNEYRALQLNFFLREKRKLGSGTDDPSRPDGLSKVEVSRLVHDGKLLYELGRSSEAEVRLNEALKQDPQNQAAAYYLKLLRQDRANMLVNDAKLLYEEGRLEGAEVELKEALKEDTQEVRANYYLKLLREKKDRQRPKVSAPPAERGRESAAVLQALVEAILTGDSAGLEKEGLGFKIQLANSRAAMAVSKQMIGWQAATALTKRGTNAWPAVPALLSAVTNKDMSVGVVTAEALVGIRAEESPEWARSRQMLTGQTNAARVFRHLVVGRDMFGRTYDAAHRRFGLLGLAATGPAAGIAYSDIVEVLKHDKDLELRACAAMVLGGLEAERMATMVLLKGVLQDKEEWPLVSAAAAKVLVTAAPAEAETRDLLRQALQDPRSAVRLADARALWRMPAPADEVLRVLTALLNNKLVSTRAGALNGLCEMGSAARPSVPEVQRLTTYPQTSLLPPGAALLDCHPPHFSTAVSSSGAGPSTPLASCLSWAATSSGCSTP